MKVVEHSWREFFDIHPAAAFFHQFSSDEQLQDLADDIDKQEVILAPIHTANVVGKAKPFVIDGISRLDAAEKTGRQIVRENGEWMGMLSNVGSSRSVIHHPGMTDAEVWSIVASLNGKRRHLTKKQIVEAADRMLELETAGKSAAKDDLTSSAQSSSPTEGKKELASSARSFSPTRGKRGGSTKDPHKAALKERAEEIAGEPVSTRTVEKYLADQPDRSKPKSSKKGRHKEVPFADQVHKKWMAWINRFQHEQRTEIYAVVHEWTEWLSDYDAPRHMRISGLVRDWIAWLSRFKERHGEVAGLVHGFTEQTQKRGDNQ
jgi:hypothetical protein